MSVKNIVKLAQKRGVKLDTEKIQEAHDFASFAHQHQTRYTGEPYIIHPLAVAEILADWGQDQTIIIAALLHDTVEDTQTPLSEIKKRFGADVAFLVDSVTKVGRVKLRHSTDILFVENLRKMFVSMAKDARVVLIRLADRLHNVRTLAAVPLIKQERIAKETLEIYAPLAERLGMGNLKGELEDLTFPYAYPKQADKLRLLAQPHFDTAHTYTKKAISTLTKQLHKANINAQIDGRPKHRYSLFKKLKRPGIDGDINKIHDLIALRIITQNKTDCYAVLGVIHGLWQPVPHLGISDFIAQPKPNGYQSIHTKVFNRTGQIIELQIRTDKMHQHAEFGAAAHFAYSQAKSQGASDQDLESGTAFNLSSKKMNWVTQLAEWQQEVENSEEFVTSLKLDALKGRLYIFSPLGDVFDLPQEATPIDFAYAVHTDLTNFIGGAKVNGKLVSLSHSLISGDVVEIIKTKQPKTPSRDWLAFVKTRRARNKIAQQLKKS